MAAVQYHRAWHAPSSFPDKDASFESETVKSVQGQLLTIFPYGSYLKYYNSPQNPLQIYENINPKP